MSEAEGGRIFFLEQGTHPRRRRRDLHLIVGVDIGSSTSHLVFSRIVLERLDSRYVVTLRETFYESDILLTPYSPTKPSTPKRSAPSSRSNIPTPRCSPTRSTPVR